MNKLLTAILIASVSPILVPYIFLERFCEGFHWPYLNLIFLPLFIPFLIIVWAVSRLNDDKFNITLLHFLKLEISDFLEVRKHESFFD